MTAHQHKSQTLVAKLRDILREQIIEGTYKVGDRLPSEALLTQEYDVSRTVVREAIAALRADGLVEPRQGSGVYVTEPEQDVAAPFKNIDTARLSSMIEMLELRAAVEVEAAGLAAQRRSPAQEERIIQALHRCGLPGSDTLPTAEADFDFHLAIAEATNNPRFAEFIKMLGQNVIPRHVFIAGNGGTIPEDYQETIRQEHDTLATAILNGDDAAARDAMRRHLKGSQSRYRALLRELGTPTP